MYDTGQARSTSHPRKTRRILWTFALLSGGAACLLSGCFDLESDRPAPDAGSPDGTLDSGSGIDVISAQRDSAGEESSSDAPDGKAADLEISSSRA
jgi:hypothetical protein